MSRPQRRAFTVVELLVVIAIIGVLVALLMPAIQMARVSGRRTQCINNQKQCALAIIEYDTAHEYLPPSRGMGRIEGAAPNTSVMNWVFSILPSLERESLQNEIRSTGYPLDPLTTLPQEILIESLLCPSARSNDVKSPCNYVLNGGRLNDWDSSIDHYNFDWIENGVFIDKGIALPVNTDPSFAAINRLLQSRHTISTLNKYDGTAQTIMLSENSTFIDWRFAPKEQYAEILWFRWQGDDTLPPATPPGGFVQPNDNLRVDATTFDNNPQYARPSSWHPGGFVVTYCDGNVRFMSEDVDYVLYAQLMTSRGERTQDPSHSGSPPLYTPPYQKERVTQAL